MKCKVPFAIYGQSLWRGEDFLFSPSSLVSVPDPKPTPARIIHMLILEAMLVMM